MTKRDPDAIATLIRRESLAAPSVRMYIVVDGCQANEFVLLAKEKYSQPARSLFKGALASCEEMELVAPYFLCTDVQSDFLNQWTEYWGMNAGVMFTSSAEPRVIFRHLRSVFVVQDESDQEYFFRFYDPRVLRVYLPTCTTEELAEFFGPIKSFMLESEDLQSIQTFEVEYGRLNSHLRLINSTRGKRSS
ncbi:MAG: DUF4123 domain-containing protein [Pirellulaceae bacterium]|nr:DUF4123 domain-containing protein [Pirellulaceae bacterium]